MIFIFLTSVLSFDLKCKYDENQCSSLGSTILFYIFYNPYLSGFCIGLITSFITAFIIISILFCVKTYKTHKKPMDSNKTNSTADSIPTINSMATHPIGVTPSYVDDDSNSDPNKAVL